jgi:predicted amidohydrolase
MQPDTVKVGIVQSGPAYLDLENSMKKAASLIQEAVNKGAQLVVFGETWLSGYPAWLDYCPEVGFWNHEPVKDVFMQMHLNSITVPGKETDLFCQMAKKHNIVICIGVNEKITNGPGNGTIYNSLLIFDESGKIACHHRKLMPTFTEKLLYGLGDGHDLKAIDTHIGRIGGLICWEHWMPLARQAMHNSNEHIHIALWPTVHETHQLASRHYAFEGRCFVVAVGQVMKVKDIPSQLKRPQNLKNNGDDFLLKGGSCIIAPDGSFLMEPQMNKEGVFVHEINDLKRIYKERLTLDTSGHYNRPDVFNFSVNYERKG